MSEGTKLVIQGLQQRRDAYKEALARGSTIYPTAEATALNTAKVVGKINEIDSMLELMLTNEEEEEDESDADNR